MLVTKFGGTSVWTGGRVVVAGGFVGASRNGPGARLVPEVGYAEAAELALSGANVLHPATIRPAIARGVPVRVRSSLRPLAPGTTVRSEAPGAGVLELAMRRGNAARVFAALGDVNVGLISQGASETDPTFVVEAPDAPEALRRLHRELFEKEAA